MAMMKLKLLTIKLLGTIRKLEIPPLLPLPEEFRVQTQLTLVKIGLK